MTNEIIDALDLVIWYNSYSIYFYKIKEDLLEAKETEINYIFEFSDDGFRIIWMILVCMFGDYGVSPRYGWLLLKNKQKIIEFINKICKTSWEGDEEIL